MDVDDTTRKSAGHIMRALGFFSFGLRVCARSYEIISLPTTLTIDHIVIMTQGTSFHQARSRGL